MTADPEAWRDQAACRHVNPRIMFPPDPEHVSASLAVCRRCPVVADCLVWAETEKVNVGTCGGEDEWARRKRLKLGPPASIAAGARTASKRKPGPKESQIVCGTDSGYHRHRRRGEEPDDACRHAHSARCGSGTRSQVA